MAKVAVDGLEVGTGVPEMIMDLMVDHTVESTVLVAVVEETTVLVAVVEEAVVAQHLALGEDTHLGAQARTDLLAGTSSAETSQTFIVSSNKSLASLSSR